MLGVSETLTLHANMHTQSRQMNDGGQYGASVIVVGKVLKFCFDLARDDIVDISFGCTNLIMSK